MPAVETLSFYGFCLFYIVINFFVWLVYDIPSGTWDAYLTESPPGRFSNRFTERWIHGMSRSFPMRFDVHIECNVVTSGLRQPRFSCYYSYCRNLRKLPQSCEHKPSWWCTELPAIRRHIRLFASPWFYSSPMSYLSVLLLTAFLA